MLTRRDRQKRLLRRLFGAALILYFTPLIVLGLFQEQFIFHPNHYTTAAWPGARLPAGVELMTLPTRRDGPIQALYAPALLANGRPDSGARLRPTLLYLHGNGGDLRETLGEVRSFQRLGMNVMAPDYVGYGASRRTPTEEGCDEAAQTAFGALRRRPGIIVSHIVILGHSLGTGVAVDLVRQAGSAGKQIAGLALVSGFSDMPEEGHSQYPIYPTLLLRLVSRDSFESERHIADVTCPLFIAHSRSDELIPYWMSGRLAAAAGGPVTRVAFDHVAHGYAFSTGAPQLFPQFRAWVYRVTHAPSASQFSQRGHA